MGVVGGPPPKGGGGGEGDDLPLCFRPAVPVSPAVPGDRSGPAAAGGARGPLPLLAPRPPQRGPPVCGRPHRVSRAQRESASGRAPDGPHRIQGLLGPGAPVRLVYGPNPKRRARASVFPDETPGPTRDCARVAEGGLP